MSIGEMTEARLRDIIASYGAEPGAWPNKERDAALALLAAAPERFAVELAGARGLDRILSKAPAPEYRPDLAARILEQAPRTRRYSGLGRVLRGRFRFPAGAVLASTMIGLVTGYAYAAIQPAPAYDEADLVYAGVFGSAAIPAWLEEDFE